MPTDADVDSSTKPCHVTRWADQRSKGAIWGGIGRSSRPEKAVCVCSFLRPADWGQCRSCLKLLARVGVSGDSLEWKSVVMLEVARSSYISQNGVLIELVFLYLFVFVSQLSSAM